eukprot:gene27859-34418_t
MSKQVLEANRHAEYTSNINLVDRQLYGCTIRAPGSEAAEAGRATADEKEGGVVEELGDLLVLDTFTHTLLGKRALAQPGARNECILTSGAGRAYLELALRALAEKELGMDLADVDPQAIAFIVERSKKAGNEAYQRRDYQEAIKLYSQAIAGDDKDKTLYSNRSAAYLSIGRYDDALVDAASCVRVDDAWAKGYFRLGNAYLAQQQWAEAAASFTRGIELAPDSKDMQVKLELAKEHRAEEEQREHRAEEEQAAQLQTKMQRRGIVLKLREARRSDNREIMLTQWRQSMTGPDWEAEDYEWRPTFLPGMRLRPIDKEVFESDPKRKMIVGYAAALAELDEPKRALGTLVDTARVNAFTEAVTRVVSEQRAALGVAPHAFCLSAGGGLLPLCIARA